jgi:hypothetical protein
MTADCQTHRPDAARMRNLPVTATTGTGGTDHATIFPCQMRITGRRQRNGANLGKAVRPPFRPRGRRRGGRRCHHQVPNIWAQDIKNVTLRHRHRRVEPQCRRRKGEAGPGFQAQDDGPGHRRSDAEGGNSAEILRHRDIEYFAIKKVFPTGVMQPMDARKIKLAG